MITFNDTNKNPRVVVPTLLNQYTPITIGNDSYWSDILQIQRTTALYAYRSDVTRVEFTNLTTVWMSGLSATFQQCSHLTEAIFPALTSIDRYGMDDCFYKCQALSSVSFPVLYSVTDYAFNYAFASCTALTRIDFPKLSTYPPSTAFYSAFTGCTNLSEIHVPRGLAASMASRIYGNAPQGSAIVKRDL